jgi:SEC-C motif-containing protein
VSRSGEQPSTAPTCLCGSGGTYAACCGPLHDNRVQAETAERLMRSRYAAYALGRLDHVYRTWHPRTRPDDLAPDPGTRWTGLTVRATEAGQPGDDQGVVEFEAAYRTAAGPGVLHERSRFARRAGRWFYLGGDTG